ncbi:MAG: hypothetical protein AAGG02_08510 [Cyanobacteria bacterium P01_H01_bin.15]
MGHAFEQVMTFLSEAISRIFGPNQDDFPATGVQPYSGDPHSGVVEQEG